MNRCQGDHSKDRSSRRGSEEPHQENLSNKEKPSMVSPKRSHFERHPVSGTRRGSSEEEPLGEALRRAGPEVKAWLECTPWWRLRRATTVENAPGDISLRCRSEEQPP
jgi:hypothetical protein